VGHQTLSADEPFGRSPGHCLMPTLPLAPMGARGKQPQPNNLPRLLGRLKVRKKVDTTLSSGSGNGRKSGAMRCHKLCLRRTRRNTPVSMFTSRFAALSLSGLVWNCAMCSGVISVSNNLPKMGVR
jgi:hypothetical protein